MIANVAVETTQTAYAVMWIDGGHLADLIDDWARGTHTAGAYDLAAHALLADMALECGDLDNAATMADLAGDHRAARDWRLLANAVSLDGLRILDGLHAGRSLDDLAAG